MGYAELLFHKLCEAGTGAKSSRQIQKACFDMLVVTQLIPFNAGPSWCAFLYNGSAGSWPCLLAY